MNTADMFRNMRPASIATTTALLCCLGVAACTEGTGEQGGDGGGGTSAGPGTISASTSNGGTGSIAPTSSSASTSTGSGGSEPGTPVLIAQGHAGRTMLSCDDGLTWVNDRSDDDTVRCEGEFDCDHHVGSGTGLVSSGGYAIMSNGWGTPGLVRRTTDGVTWDVILELDFPLASLAVGGGIVMGSTPLPQTSSDDGGTWADVPEIYLAPPLRSSLYIPHEGGRFVLVSQGNGFRAWLSDDLGATFHESSPIPDNCIAFSLVYGNGALVMPSMDGGACRSADGGETWSVVSVGANLGLSTLAFAGDRFVMLGEGNGGLALHTSTDGASWSSATTNLQVGAWNAQLGRNTETGTLLVASGAYENQRFFRSTDGLSWTEAASATQSHPIRRFVAARLEAPACL